MDTVVCKKCGLENEAILDYCQLCGTNLKGGQDSMPGHVYIVQTPKLPFLDTYVAWGTRGIYFIFMTNISAYIAGEFIFGPIKDVARKEQISQYKKNVFRLPLDAQLDSQNGILISYDDIQGMKEKKGFLSTISSVEVISKQGKLLATIRGSDQNRANFCQEAKAHGFEVK